MTLGEYVAAVPGIVAMLGAAGVFGALRSRVASLERAVDKLEAIKSEVATIAERTRNTSDDMTGIRADISTITSHLLGEKRSFAPDRQARDRRDQG